MNLDYVKKRDGKKVEFKSEKIENAVAKAAAAVEQADPQIAAEITAEVLSYLKIFFKNGGAVEVEQIQDLVEKVLIEKGYAEIAKAYILYREQHSKLRDSKKLFADAVNIMDDYLDRSDWKVNENSNMSYSLQGLNNYIASEITGQYWLQEIYPKETAALHSSGDLHIHDLGNLSVYCCGWDLEELLRTGFRGVPTKIESAPPKHLKTALGQIVNFMYTLQGECYSADTEVLTEKGWKYFYDLNERDKVCTINPETDKIEYQKPLRYIEKTYDGKMLYFSQRSLDMMVTPNHKLLVEQYAPHREDNYYKKFVLAKNFNSNNNFIPKQGNWEAEKKEYFVLPPLKTEVYQFFGDNYVEKMMEVPKIKMNTWLAFFGFWIAEGSAHERKRKMENRSNYSEYIITITQNENHNVTELKKVLAELPFEYHISRSRRVNGPDKLNFRINSKQLYNYLKKFGHAGDKYIPEKIKALDKSQLEILFNWMMKGDGYIGNGNYEYYTKSKKLADDVQEIMTKLGYCANIYTKTKGKFKWYVISRLATKMHKVAPKNINEVEYSGKVYCVEVPNQTLLVRRNGKSVWGGNCAGAQAFSNFDTYLAPFIAYDDLNYEEVKQAMQEFLFNMNVPTRVGFQSPFTNITMDLKVPNYLKDQAVIIGGRHQEKCYGEFQQEMDMLNRAFAELMMEGDAKGRMFSFPIPTYNITEDFEWENEKLDPVWEMTAKFGIPYFSNFINSDMDPEDARSMCLHPEENIFLKKNDEIKKMTIGKLFEKYKGEKLDKNWFFASSNIETLSLNPKTGELEWAKINKFLKTQGKQLVTITAKDGKTMKVSPEHLVAVYTEKGIKTKKAKELEDSDFLLVMQDASGALKCEDNISEELAWFMGLFIADGNYLYDSRYEEEVLRGIQISFNKQEKSLIEKTKRFIKDYLDYDMKFVLDPRYDNSLRGYIYNSEFANIFKHDYKVRKYNRLPSWIWSSSPANISSFIEGFFDGDGYENGNEIHINDKKLAAELNLLIQLVGISTTLRYRKNSQVIRFQHVLGRGAYNNKIIKDSLHNLIPEFLLEQKVVKDELGKKRYQSYGCKMVGLSSVDRWDISNDKIEFLRNADFAVTEIRDIKINDLDYKQTFYDIELEKNHYFVHSDGNITHNCCRLRLDNKELRKRGGGLFGANPLTGSIGVVTLNMPRIGYQAETKEEFMKRVYYLMDQAKESLEIKRKVLENLTDQGLYPYAKFYLRDIKKRFDQYWKNHFNTIGLNGMNEALLNFMGKNISTPAGKRFSEEVMEKMRERLQQYQEETDNLYNLEATPAEGTAYRFARLDREKFGNQITAANQGRVLAENADPYYTNSTQLPVDFTNDIFTALELQDNLQSMYTGGCIEKGNKVLTNKGAIEIGKIVKDYDNLKPIKALSYNAKKDRSEWDLITDAMSIDVSKNNKIRVTAEKGLDITTSDWHPFFVLEKISVKDKCPICGEKVKGAKSFSTHTRYNPECRKKYKTMFKFQVVEKRADELNIGDYILQNSENLYPEKKSLVDSDLMWLFGYFIGDGSISEYEDNRGGNHLRKYKLRFNDEHLSNLEKAKKIINNKFNTDINIMKNDNRSKKLYELATTMYSVNEFFLNYGFFSGEKCYEVNIPEQVKENITKNNVYSLLSGLIDSDGHINKRQGDIEYYTVSEELADDIFEILTTAGIMVSKEDKPSKRKNDVDGFRIRIPAQQATKIKNKLTITNDADFIKDNLSLRKRRQLPVVRVKKTSKIEVEDNEFYDLTTEKNHNYLAGNSTMVFIHNTVFHGFLGEKIDSITATKKLVKRIAENFKLPYYTLTPSFSICPVHGYLPGEHKYCPKCEAEAEAEDAAAESGEN